MPGEQPFGSASDVLSKRCRVQSWRLLRRGSEVIHGACGVLGAHMAHAKIQNMTCLNNLGRIAPLSVLVGAMALMAPVAHADETMEAALGGGIGGAIGAVIGSQVGGERSAALGGALGAAVGTVISVDDNDDHPNWHDDDWDRDEHWNRGERWNHGDDWQDRREERREQRQERKEERREHMQEWREERREQRSERWEHDD